MKTVGQAIKSFQLASTALVVGTDTDILVLPVAPPTENKIFLEIATSTKTGTVYSVHFLAHMYDDQRKFILFFHAVTECDTISALYGVGKMKAVSLITTPTDLKAHVGKDLLFEDGERFLLSQHGLSEYKNLDEARYFKFKHLNAKMSLKSNFDWTRKNAARSIS